MSAAYINGLGTVSAHGRGIDSLENALTRGWAAPELVPLPFFRAAGFPIYAVPPESLKDRSLSRKLRRADRLSKMAVVAAADAVAESGVEIMDPGRFGIVFATAFGPHATTFKFLDDIIDYGDAGVSPTAFSHSVHNAAASYVANVLGIRGPVITVTHFHFAFQEALRIARIWLEEGRCDHVLVGTADECGTAMEYIASRKLQIAADGRIYPFRLDRMPPAVPGEGSAFLLLSGAATESSYCHISTDEAPAADTELQIINTDAMSLDESAYQEALLPHVPVTAYTPVFGSFMTSSSFDCAAAALMIRNRAVHPPPVLDNPRNLTLRTESGPPPRRITCTKCDCTGRQMTTQLSACNLE